MDTREKIVAEAGLRALLTSGEWVLVVGQFDPMTATQAKRLELVEKNGGRLLAVVVDGEDDLLPGEARAALLASLRAVDMVAVMRGDDWRAAVPRSARVRILEDAEAGERTIRGIRRLRTEAASGGRRYGTARVSSGASSSGTLSSILIIRLGAMGDILHTVPAAISLKKSFPDRKLAWLVAPRWKALLEGNPFIDELISFDRKALRTSWKALRQERPKLAFDFQGLVQSALLGRAAQPERLFGFDRRVAREPLAALFYTDRVAVKGPHRVERNVQLAAAAGAEKLTYDCWIPAGKPEGTLPAGPFVLTNPFAGWAGKEWPLASFDELGQRLLREGLELVSNVPESRAGELRGLKHLRVHTSTLEGLIDATRRAAAVVGLDSGPLHLAAALAKPGVGLYGPTDPLRTGPFGGTMAVLRADDVETTYKRHAKIHASMREISPEAVAQALLSSLSASASAARNAVNAPAVASLP